MADELLATPEEMSAYLNLNVRTIYRLIRDGLPAVRVGRQWRFRRTDVDHWLLAGGRRRLAHAQVPPVRRRVLVVDDEQPVREMVAKTLSVAEYEVDTAADGPEAVERLRQSAYDLLITDLKMPGMDGLSVIREVRRTSATLPIVIMTAFSTEASAIEAINLGVRGYLTKPFRLPRILAVAAQALGMPLPAASDA